MSRIEKFDFAKFAMTPLIYLMPKTLEAFIAEISVISTIKDLLLSPACSMSFSYHIILAHITRGGRRGAGITVSPSAFCGDRQSTPLHHTRTFSLVYRYPCLPFSY